MSQDLDAETIARLDEYVRTEREKDRDRQSFLPPSRMFVRDCPACNGNGFIIKMNNHWGREEQRPCVSCGETGQLKCSAYAEGARRVSEWEWAG
jgi:DnaJ-class molecular chaperone